MSKEYLSKLLCAIPALLLCASVAYTPLASAATTTPVSPLTATPSKVAVSYQKPSTPGAAVALKVTATNSTFFTVDPTTVPIWLNLDAMNGTASSTGATLNFTANSVSASLGAGTYSGTVHLQVIGQPDLSVPVSLVVNDAPSTLTVKEGNSLTLSWSQGSSFPTASTLTLMSSNQPISFTAAAAVTQPTSPAGWLKVNKASGVAYAWGTPIVLSFVPQVFQMANVGDQLTGTVTITPAGGSAITVNVTVNVTPPVAAITSLYPSQVSVQANAQASDTLNVVISGSGFIAAPANQKTTITINTTDVLDASKVTVVSNDTLIVALPSATYLNQTGTVAIAAQNPNPGGTAATAASANLAVTANPIIYAVTNSASFIQAGPGSTPNVAPYELISIFGDNFGAGTGNTLTAALDSFSRYPTTLVNANDTNNSSNAVSVSFYKSDGTTLIGTAPLLFATQNQINCIVPAAVVGNTAAIIKVNYGTSSSSTVSSAYNVNVVGSDPGIFTTSSSGQGQAAILHSSDYSANSATNKAAKGSTVLIYLTGLGAPNSTAANTASTAAAAFPAACISTTAYMGTVNALATPPSSAWTSIDGAVILSSNITSGHFAPCFATQGAVTVTIDGKPATVSYAGFVADSLAGLYQINVAVPAAATSGTAIPVVVTMGSTKSQANVTMAIQ